MLLFVFFCLQAEDGIRDIGVTGVQTCALPICPRDPERAGDEEATPAGLLQLQRNAIPELGANLGGAVVPTSGESSIPGATHQVSGDAADARVHRRAEEAGAAGSPRIHTH